MQSDEVVPPLARWSPPDIAHLETVLGATVAVRGVGSGTGASIPVLGRIDPIADQPIPPGSGCYAPNKRSLRLGSETLYEELIVVRLLERAGWSARWVNNFTSHGTPRFCRFANRVDPIESHDRPALNAFTLIAERCRARLQALYDGGKRRSRPAQGKTPTGSWDVFAWRDGSIAFVEVKEQGEDLTPEQELWYEVARELGLGHEAFVIVEYVTG